MTGQEILVARHGETEWNRRLRWQGLSDIPLNETGLLQARELGHLLKNENIRAVYSSDLKRARKTAEIVSEILGISDIKTEPRLRERFLGKFEGWNSIDVARYAGIPEENYEVLETDELIIDGLEDVEPWENFRLRIWQAFLDIASESLGEKVLIVGHGGVMRAIYLTINTDYSGFPPFQNCEFIRARKTGSKWASD